MANPFTLFKITPNYSRGFYYSWELSGDFNDQGPWDFRVQEGISPTGPWKVISPKLSNIYSWKEDSRTQINKSNVLYFRIQLKTPEGLYYSPVIQPYGVLNKRDFLLSREILRQSLVYSRLLGGIECNAYIKSTFGPKCRKCLDPITGMIRDSHCKHCFGTGRSPAYTGPYKAWIDFAPNTQHQTEVDKTGTIEKKTLQAKVIGNPILKQGDIVVNPTTDKRYYITQVSSESEMRGIPLIQQLVLDEAPQTDAIYTI